MSWDIVIINFSKNYKAMDEIPENEQPLDLGTRSFIHQTVLEFFPNTNWSDSSWGIFDSEFGSIGFNIGPDDPISDMMLHVRASNEIVIPIILMCKKHSWSAIDCGSGDFLEQLEDPTLGLERWRSYLSQILNNNLT